MPRQRPFLCVAVLALLLARAATAATTLEEAREMALAGRRAQALALLEKRLAEAPGDDDARTYYGIVLSWEHRYDEARKALEPVLAAHPESVDARLALANVEWWSGRSARALELLRTGLQQDPRNADLRAAHTRVARSVRDEVTPWYVRVVQTHEWLSGSGQAWHEYQVEARRSFSSGPVLLRVSRANRFGRHGNQAELDWYPRLAAGTYAYLNAGYSYDAGLYPRRRVGAELFQALPKTTEISGGYRRLGFGNVVDVYTGSLGKYQGNWWFNGRFYLKPDSVGTSATVLLSTRRYFGSFGDYIGVRVGRGSVPSEIDNITDLAILNSTAMYGELTKSVNRTWVLALRAGFSREDRTGQAAATRALLEASIGVRF
jgi:YaiO family outer membrane protein